MVHDLDFIDCCLGLLTVPVALKKFEILKMVVINYLLEINGRRRWIHCDSENLDTMIRIEVKIGWVWTLKAVHGNEGYFKPHKMS